MRFKYFFNHTMKRNITLWMVFSMLKYQDLKMMGLWGLNKLRKPRDGSASSSLTPESVPLI
jgi:hypothetical protein